MTDCLFCKIAAGEIPAEKVHEDDALVAFRDINPKAPTHILVIPREHIPSLDDLEERHAAVLGRIVLAAKEIAAKEKLADGYRFVFNCGPAAGQEVYHIHAHLLGGRPMTWPPG